MLQLLIHGHSVFVYNGTNKFTKQVDQSLMNFYLIDGFMYILPKYAAFPNHFLILYGIYFAKQNCNLSHMQSNITKYNILIPQKLNFSKLWLIKSYVKNILWYRNT